MAKSLCHLLMKVNHVIVQIFMSQICLLTFAKINYRENFQIYSHKQVTCNWYMLLVNVTCNLDLKKHSLAKFCQHNIRKSHQ